MVDAAVVGRARSDSSQGHTRAVRLAPSPKLPGLVLTSALCCAAAGGCGGSAPRASTAPTARAEPVAQRVCADVRGAAAPLLGAKVHMRIADSDPANLECLLDGRGIHVDVVAQASPRAWTQYDTATVHLVQAFGSGSVHTPSELPHPVPGLGGNSTWIPAQHELLATNGTQSAGGSYVTVTITRASARGPASVSLAGIVARATLDSAPRGPSPGPPPS